MVEDSTSEKTTQNVSIVSLFANLFLLIIKICIGIVSRSQGVIADSLNSAGDIFASLMSYIGSKIAYKPQDGDHPNGHGKAEYIYSELIGLSMIFASIIMIKKSITSIINNQSVIFSKLLIIICVIVIIVKFILFIYTSSKYKFNKSILIKSNMIDHRNDMLITLGTIIGIIFSYFGYHFVDGMMGSIISLVILSTGINIFRSSYMVLMDTSISKENIDYITKEIKKFENVLTIDNIYTKPIGDKSILILEISMDGKITLEESHNVGNNIENDILQKFSYIKQVIIHINPKN